MVRMSLLRALRASGQYRRVLESGSLADGDYVLTGKLYEFGGPAFNANGGFVWFTIQGGKSVQVPMPGGS